MGSCQHPPHLHSISPASGASQGLSHFGFILSPCRNTYSGCNQLLAVVSRSFWNAFEVLRDARKVHTGVHANFELHSTLCHLLWQNLLPELLRPEQIPPRPQLATTVKTF